METVPSEVNNSGNITGKKSKQQSEFFNFDAKTSKELSTLSKYAVKFHEFTNTKSKPELGCLLYKMCNDKNMELSIALEYCLPKQATEEQRNKVKNQLEKALGQFQNLPIEVQQKYDCMSMSFIFFCVFLSAI